MRITYAYRRSTVYPYQIPFPTPHLGNSSTSRKAWKKFLRSISDIGFQGIELRVESLGGLDATKADVYEQRKLLEDHGTPCTVVKGGAVASTTSKVACEFRAQLEKAVEIASWVGSETVNTGVIGSMYPQGPLLLEKGGVVSAGSSSGATEEDFIRAAQGLREVSAIADVNGINITIEVHQHTLADNSSSTLRILDLADRPNLFANPDLGNILWNYETPEETTEEAILALAPRSKYWHCKNLRRIHIPEIEHSYFIRVPLPDGDIDYRFAISAMVDAGFDGYLAIEGAITGDQLYLDKRSFEYVKQILSEITPTPLSCR